MRRLQAAPYSRLTLRFHDSAAEAAFAREQALRSVLPARWICAAIAGMVVATALAVVLLFPQASVRIGIILWTMLAAVAAIFVATWLPAWVSHHQAATASAAAIATGAMFITLVNYPVERVAATGFFMPAMQVICIYTLFRLRFPLAAALGWSTLAVHLALVSGFHGVTGEHLHRHGLTLAFANLLGMLIGWQLESAQRIAFLATREVEQERARSDNLLLNILPAPIAQRLKAAPGVIAEDHASVTVLFADIVGFTTWCAQRAPDEVLKLLDRVFTAFDDLAQRHGLEKIKTIGDCYMAVAGVPVAREDHARAALSMARDMLARAAALAAETGEPLQLRVGLSSGPVVAGVIGRSKFIFDLWGDTVNTASRMESHGQPGRIQCCPETARLLAGEALVPREGVQVRGKGEMRVYLVAA